MSWRDAPLYVEAHDLAGWLLAKVEGWPGQRVQLGTIATMVTGAAAELVVAVSLALTFPATREQHLEAADHAVVRLRELLRLARDAGLISPGATRHAAGRLAAVGRMIGGWRKRLARPEPGGPEPGARPR